MLSAKPWKMDAIVRLIASVLVCVFLGSLVSLAVQWFAGTQEASALPFFAAVAGGFGAFAGALILLCQPWRYMNLTRRLAALLVCVYAGLVLSWCATRLGGDVKTGDSTWKTVLAVLCFQGAALVLIFRFLREYQTGWTQAFGFNVGWERAVLLGTVAAFVFLPAGWALQAASIWIMEMFHWEPQEQTAVQMLRASGTWADWFSLGAAAILVVPVAEETLFRGILYPAVKQRGHPRLALWGAALGFAAIHMNAATFLPLTLLALVLTWLYEKTNNLLAPIVTHGLFNAMNFALLYLQESFTRLPAKS